MLTINVISTINVMKTQTINVINYKIINHKCTNILTINVVSIENRMNSSTFFIYGTSDVSKVTEIIARAILSMVNNNFVPLSAILQKRGSVK